MKDILPFLLKNKLIPFLISAIIYSNETFETFRKFPPWINY